MPHPSFEFISHRPWSLPERPWLLEQTWTDLLFLHWEIDPAELRDWIPEGLEIDTFNGRAWIAVVPFFMESVGPRGFPKPSSVSDFPEINVRTYVIKDGKPGVFFLSLDVPNRLPVWIARTFFHLPYYHAEMDARVGSDGWIDYRSVYGKREFSCRYRGSGFVDAAPGSFEEWATERYCLYSFDTKKRRLFCGEIHHKRWPLQKAEFEIESNSMFGELEAGPMHPIALFSKKIEVATWLICKV